MKLSDSPATLREGYGPATKNPDKMRGWKRALTLYCNRKSQETTRPTFRFKAAIKMVLTKDGYDVSQL